MGKIKIDGGSVRTAKDGSGGGAVTKGSGKGTEDNPHVRTTTSVDKEGNVTDTHTTAEVDGKKWSDKKPK